MTAAAKTKAPAKKQRKIVSLDKKKARETILRCFFAGAR